MLEFMTGCQTDRIRKQASLLILLSGLFLSYVWFFIFPVFLNPDRTMKFIEYIVKIDPIGLDLAQMLDYSRAWFFWDKSPYVGANLYPPLAVVLFRPLLKLNPATTYHVITLLNLLCYLLSVLVLPYLLHRQTERLPLLTLIFTSGLFSYGFHFELERGQFNLIAMTCCLLALYLFHKHETWTVAAYLFFCLSVQLKIYPAIFVLLFVRDWRDRRDTLLRIGGLLLANAALFFVLGIDVFQDFLAALIRESASNLWIGNHSIRAFVLLSPLPWKSASIIFLLALTLGLLGIVTLCSYRQHPRAFNAPLFLACSISALLIPSVSNDYKLLLVSIAMSLAFPHSLPKLRGLQAASSYVLLLLVAFAYGTTLYSFTNKPLLFKNNLPALLFLLAAWTFLVVGGVLASKRDGMGKARTSRLC